MPIFGTQHPITDHADGTRIAGPSLPDWLIAVEYTVATFFQESVPVPCLETT